MSYMVIDIGSNTVKYNLFSVDETGRTVKKKGRSFALGFINFIKNGIPSDEGIDKLCNILLDYTSESDSGYSVYATASFRSCDDPYYPVRKVYEKTGINVRLLSGEEEAYYSLQGVLVGFPNEKNGVMIDMGGASTELNFFTDRKSDYLVSLPFGALKLLKLFAKRDDGVDGISRYCTRKELENIAEYVSRTFDSLVDCKNESDKLFLVGGSATAIGKIIKSERSFDGELTLDELKAIYEKFCEIDDEKDVFLRSVMPDRYLLITPAISTFIVLCEKLSVNNIIISKSGIRDGYFDCIKNGTIQ